MIKKRSQAVDLTVNEVSLLMLIKLRHLLLSSPLTNPHTQPRAHIAYTVPGVNCSHVDINVTFHGLASLSALSLATFSPSVSVFAGGEKPGVTTSWTPRAPDGPLWVGGSVEGGILDLRVGQEALNVRVLADNSIVETFWDGGRARTTQV